ncbi:predicted protein [Streptomyces filamentosus NRRL 15998]|uniref:Predicted protein n=1 Tax=Streptomyces filamentosus NRRL 15998 TaxID=457431 RepID=D6AS66_STRFL|nr:predicted protein [Streptomyces filamentosus NRRL 15998]
MRPWTFRRTSAERLTDVLDLQDVRDRSVGPSDRR